MTASCRCAGCTPNLNVGGEQIASGVSDHAFVVPAFGESEFDMTITANMALALLKLADKANQHADSIDYDLTGAASIDLPFLARFAVSSNAARSRSSQQ